MTEIVRERPARAGATGSGRSRGGMAAPGRLPRGVRGAAAIVRRATGARRRPGAAAGAPTRGKPARRTAPGLLLVLLPLVACGPPAPDENGYLEQLVEARAYKDEFLASDPESFVPLDRRSWMVPLRYYEPDPSYRVPARLAVADEQPVYDVPTSTGQIRRMQRIGHLEFVLHGEPRRLTALLSDEEGLFVPFRDDTSRDETYPAGRYIDLPFSPTGVYDLDFNRAYHPTCYFDEQYDCPFPPPENRLRTAIRAGEKLPPVEERRLPVTVPAGAADP